MEIALILNHLLTHPTRVLSSKLIVQNSSTSLNGNDIFTYMSLNVKKYGVIFLCQGIEISLLKLLVQLVFEPRFSKSLSNIIHHQLLSNLITSFASGSLFWTLGLLEHYILSLPYSLYQLDRNMNAYRTFMRDLQNLNPYLVLQMAVFWGLVHMGEVILRYAFNAYSVIDKDDSTKSELSICHEEESKKIAFFKIFTSTSIASSLSNIIACPFNELLVSRAISNFRLVIEDIRSLNILPFNEKCTLGKDKGYSFSHYSLSSVSVLSLPFIVELTIKSLLTFTFKFFAT